MEIFVYTMEHEELLTEKLGPKEARKNLKTAANALTQAALVLFPNLDFAKTHGIFWEFLVQNNYIYFDGFLRICLGGEND